MPGSKWLKERINCAFIKSYGNSGKEAGKCDVEKLYNVKKTFLTSLSKCCGEASKELDKFQGKKNQLM